MFDFSIVGAGMVGSATALGLAKLGYRVALIDMSAPKAFDADQRPDLRVSAINLSTQRLLENLGVWPIVLSMRLTPFVGMQVWEQEYGKTTFNCDDIGMPYLGHIVENRLLQVALQSKMAGCGLIKQYTGCSIADWHSGPVNRLTLSNNQQLQSRFVIGADGAQSIIRQKCQIGTQGWQYRQQAMGINIALTELHDKVTWQYFRPSGPLAFLPLYDHFASLVWYDSPKVIAKLKQLDKPALKQQIQRHFPDKLGDFSILQSASFPLTRMHANQYVKAHCLLIGDAAHTINPLAGQGVNLGFKDVESLIDVIGSGMTDAEIRLKMKCYEAKRRKDNLLMMSAMDGIYTLFSNDIGPLRLLRNGLFAFANRSGPLKNQVMKYAMGLN